MSERFSDDAIEMVDGTIYNNESEIPSEEEPSGEELGDEEEDDEDEEDEDSFVVHDGSSSSGESDDEYEQSSSSFSEDSEQPVKRKHPRVAIATVAKRGKNEESE